MVGTSGSGKTLVAEALAAKLGIPYICNDAILWRADWQPTAHDEAYAEFDAATRAEAWTFDGNLGKADYDQLVLSRCDTLVWLDLPFWQVIWGVTRRTTGRAITKEQLWHGNTERWRALFSRDSMIWWSVKTFSRRRRSYAALFEDDAYADRARIRLSSRREVNEWLESLPGPAG